MQTIYSAEFIQDNCACYSEEKGKLEKYLKGRKEISYLDILKSDIPLKDKYWFFCKYLSTEEPIFVFQRNVTIKYIKIGYFFSTF